MVFRQNCQISQNFLLFVLLNTFYIFAEKFRLEGNFRFQANFHEYILNIASYQVTEAINGCVELKFN